MASVLVMRSLLCVLVLLLAPRLASSASPACQAALLRLYDAPQPVKPVKNSVATACEKTIFGGEEAAREAGTVLYSVLPSCQDAKACRLMEGSAAVKASWRMFFRK